MLHGVFMMLGVPALIVQVEGFRIKALAENAELWTLHPLQPYSSVFVKL